MSDGVVDAPGAGTLSVIMPAYNEGAGILAVIDEWRDELVRASVDAWEIVICDDGSQDESPKLLDEAAAADFRIRVVHHASNQGASAAIRTALAASRCHWVLFVDADGQFPAANLEAMLAGREAGVRAVTGVRRSKADTRARRFGAWATSVAVNRAHRTRYSDVSSMMKLVDGRLARSLVLESSGLNMSVELASRIAELGIDWREVPIAHQARAQGSASWRFLQGASRRGAYVGYLAARQALIRRGLLTPKAVADEGA